MLTNKVEDIVFQEGLLYFDGKECKVELLNLNGDSLGWTGVITAHHIENTLVFSPVVPENTNIDIGDLPLPQKANFVKVYLVDEENLVLLFTQVLYCPFYVNNNGRFSIGCIILNNQATTSNHTHTIANITNLQTALDEKADTNNTYTKTEVDTAINNKKSQYD